jgi:nucleoside-diphosphate-sugar epimerase
MKVLVTGASGMLGAATAHTIAERGHEVTVLQRSQTSLPFRQMQADIRDGEAVRRACGGMNAIVHLAARVSIVGTWSDFAGVNVDGTQNLLTAASECGVERFVHVSTPSVAHTGTAIVGADAEPADPDHARGHYARSKAIAENLVLNDVTDLQRVAIRPHLVWGPGDTQLIGRIVDRARKGRLVLLGDGAALIDTTYVVNAATAIAQALERVPLPEVNGQAFVVSNGEPRTVAELFTRIAVACGVNPPSRRVPVGVAKVGGRLVEGVWALGRRSDDPPMTHFLAEQLSTAHWFDQRRTRQALAWMPEVDLETGFAELSAWREA